MQIMQTHRLSLRNFSVTDNHIPDGESIATGSLHYAVKGLAKWYTEK